MSKTKTPEAAPNFPFNVPAKLEQVLKAELPADRVFNDLYWDFYPGTVLAEPLDMEAQIRQLRLAEPPTNTDYGLGLSALERTIRYTDRPQSPSLNGIEIGQGGFYDPSKIWTGTVIRYDMERLCSLPARLHDRRPVPTSENDIETFNNQFDETPFDILRAAAKPKSSSRAGILPHKKTLSIIGMFEELTPQQTRLWEYKRTIGHGIVLPALPEKILVGTNTISNGGYEPYDDFDRIHGPAGRAITLGFTEYLNWESEFDGTTMHRRERLLSAVSLGMDAWGEVQALYRKPLIRIKNMSSLAIRGARTSVRI